MRNIQSPLIDRFEVEIYGFGFFLNVYLPTLVSMTRNGTGGDKGQMFLYGLMKTEERKAPPKPRLSTNYNERYEPSYRMNETSTCYL